MKFEAYCYLTKRHVSGAEALPILKRQLKEALYALTETDIPAEHNTPEKNAHLARAIATTRADLEAVRLEETRIRQAQEAANRRKRDQIWHSRSTAFVH